MDPNDLQVVISLKSLTVILESAQQIPEMVTQLHRLASQVQGLRRQLFEVVERIEQLKQ